MVRTAQAGCFEDQPSLALVGCSEVVVSSGALVGFVGRFEIAATLVHAG